MKIVKAFYSYSVNFAALASGQNDTASFNIEADSDFRLEEISYFADVAQAIQTDASRVIPLINLLITDTGSGRQFMNADQPIFNIAGSGERPFILPEAKLFPKRSTVLVKATNFSAGTTYNTVISFIGTKIYQIE